MSATGPERKGLPQPSQADKILHFTAWVENAPPWTETKYRQIQEMLEGVEGYLGVASSAPTPELAAASDPYVKALMRLHSRLAEVQEAIGEVGTTAAELAEAMRADSAPLPEDLATTSE